MKIGIHHRAGSFSDAWIKYCEEHNFNFKIVDAYSQDIISQLADCDAFMWHFHHAIFKDMLIAKSLLTTMQLNGKIVFPSIQTCYTFDDKVSQKYQLEAIGAKIVPSYVFYNKHDALNWTKNAKYPIVFKLSGGAGASNVKLIRNYREAHHLILKAFGNGLPIFTPWNSIKEHWGHYKQKQLSSVAFLKRVILSLRKSEFKRFHGKECGYIYFQEFIPNNDGDVRVIVIGNKAFGIRRGCRRGDFRASGSGLISYDIPPKEIAQIAFDISKKLKVDCLAFDFIFDETGQPLIVEISYGFTAAAYMKCPGYWDDNLQWHDSKVNPGELQIEQVIAQILDSNKNNGINVNK